MLIKGVYIESYLLIDVSEEVVIVGLGNGVASFRRTSVS